MSQDSMMYVGMDLGNRYTHYCVVDSAGEVVERGRFTTTAAALRKWSQGHPGASVAMETGGPTRWMALALREAGHEVVVGNARRLRAISQHERKCDDRDAELLARLLRSDPALLSPVEGFLERDVTSLATVRARAHLVEQRTAMINHVRGVARSAGARLRSCDASRFHHLREDLPEALRVALEPVMDLIEMLNEKIVGLDQTIEELCANTYPETAALRTIPGIGPVTALYFILVIANPERFDHPRDVAAYVGLVPRRDQSGDSDRQLRISKTGDTYLRRLLVIAAHSILGRWGKDSALRDWGLHKASGGRSAKKRATVAVARKLAVLMLRLWRSQESFNPWPNGEPKWRLERAAPAA